MVILDLSDYPLNDSLGRRPRPEHLIILQEVASNGDSDSAGITFLHAIIDNDSGICDGAVAWDRCNFLVSQKSDCLRALCVFPTIGNFTYLFAHCLFLNVLERRGLYQYFVAGDCFTGFRLGDAIAIFLSTDVVWFAPFFHDSFGHPLFG